MSRSILKLVFAITLLFGVWSMPTPSEAKILYAQCEVYCCSPAAPPPTFPCKTASGAVMTCGVWRAEHACP